MNKVLVLIFLLITQSLSQNVNEAYQKMKKGHGFDDDICAYTFSDITYVKPCKEGKFCKYHDELSKCTDIETKIYPKYLGQECSNNFECDNGLLCSGTCQYIGCPLTTHEAYKDYQGNYGCRAVGKKTTLYEADNSNINSYNLISTFSPNTGNPLTQSLSFHQVVGKISFFSKTDNSNNKYGTLYAIETVQSAYIGTVPDNEFVGDRLACKSGFALYFYPDGTLTDPTTDPYNHNSMYLMCVTLNDVDITNEMIKYNGDKIYNLNRNINYQEIDGYGNIQSSSGNAKRLILGQSSISELLSQKEIFEKYTEVFTQGKQEECEKQKNYEQYTCEDDEVRKWWYFLQHPGDYVIYYDKEDKDNDITNYLLQTHYRTFISGSFLYAKFLISFIMFLFL